jgi:hypothetical protein
VVRDIARAGIEVHGLEAIGRPRGEMVTHFIADTSSGRLFLKIGRPTSGPRQQLLRKLLGRPSLERQVDVLEGLERSPFPTLRYPRLVRSDRSRYVLVEHIAGARPASDGEAPEALVASLLEFQTSSAQRAFGGVVSRLLGASLAPEAYLVRRALPRLLRESGWRSAWRLVRTMHWCRRQQPALDRQVLIHNDFHHENVLIDADGVMYLTDFENAVSTRRWVLVDIVHYAVGTTSAVIDTELIRAYVAAARLVPEIGDRLALEPQLRLALLRRIAQHVSSAAVPEHVRTTYRSLLDEVLLDDERFRSWVRENIP